MARVARARSSALRRSLDAIASARRGSNWRRLDPSALWGVLLTVLALEVLGAAVRRSFDAGPGRGDTARTESAPAERVIFLDTRTARSADERFPAPVLPRGVRPGAPPRTDSARNEAAAPTPAEARPASPAPAICLGPCISGGRAGVSGASDSARASGSPLDSALADLRAGIRDRTRRIPPPSQEESDSVWRERLRRARESMKGGAEPGVGAGASIPVGLPGGGPTRAQRRRDSALHAGNLARLTAIEARLRARCAEFRADSLRRGTTANGAPLARSIDCAQVDSIDALRGRPGRPR